jgi:hypothetical protein
MNKTRTVAVCLIAGLLTTACVTIPSGPSVTVLPGSGKPFEQFQVDDAACRQWAFQQVGGTTAGEASTHSAVSGAAIGTVLGAAAGAAIGAAAGNPGAGAAVGAGVGLLGGTAAGASAGSASYVSIQRRYDTAYIQCMYAKGNQVPVSSRSYRPSYTQSGTTTPRPPAGTPPPPPPGTPPPPAGTPPPPPPGVR